MFRGIFWLPDQNQNESLQKTYCRNVLSDCCQGDCSAIQRRFPAATGSEVRLWTRSVILKKQSFSKIFNTPLPRPRPDLCECVTSIIYQELLVFFAWRAWRGGGPQLETSLRFFFVFKKSLFLKHPGDLGSTGKSFVQSKCITVNFSTNKIFNLKLLN